ncbi:hypothetical protein A2U01_0040533 [Trifolium medium]|uniref:Uncharacterized protein n=1 Tax=Trifolium medium TaxID=97028 RepID=A0A392Q655_9FABA|nr:hypothetical protein [Trifolium medium]
MYQKVYPSVSGMVAVGQDPGGDKGVSDTSTTFSRSMNSVKLSGESTSKKFSSPASNSWRSRCRRQWFR